jgi:hypothetical protein
MPATSVARDFVGVHHFGIWVDDIDTTKGDRVRRQISPGKPVTTV